MIKELKEELSYKYKRDLWFYVSSSGEINIKSVNLAISHYKSLLPMSKLFKINDADILYRIIFFSKLLIYAKHCK